MEEGNERGTLQSGAAFLQASAALLLLLSASASAVSYFVGALYQEKLARLSGLARYPADETFQWTIAQGARVLVAPGVLGAAVIICALATIAVALANQIPAVRRVKERARKEYAAEQSRLRDRQAKANPSIRSIGAYITLTLAGLWAVTDGLTTAAEAEAYKRRVELMDDVRGLCDECSTYHLPGRFVVGAPLYQSADQIFVLDRAFNVTILKTSEVRAIGGFYPEFHTEKLENLWGVDRSGLIRGKD